MSNSINQTELTLKILDKLIELNIPINENEVALSLEEILREYTLDTRSTSLAISDLPDKIYYYLACKKLEGLSLKTLKNYAYTLRHFANFVHKPVNQIDSFDIRMYIDEKSRSVSNSSLEPVISTLKSFFSWLFDEECITKNPMNKIKAPKKERSLREGLTMGEIEMLRINCETARERAIIEFFLSTGCRVGELVGLKHTGLKNGSIKVLGKGNKERVVYVNPRAELYLKIYLNSRGVDSDYMFVASKRPYKYIGPRTFQTEVSSVGDRAGLKVFPHLFRHTFATAFLENGGSMKELQEILGHEDINTTAVYGKLRPSLIQQAHTKHAII